ncbi:MAG: hypothetical protein LBK44_05155, partial [Spirochaetales bacterium]|nr:hypothetical protein [Spirochaetales bacterium]
MEFIKGNWDLDDKESETLYGLRDDTVDYMIDLVQEKKVNGYETLNEKSIDSFVNNTLESNIERKIAFLESNQSKNTYVNYAPYWLELAETYYELASTKNDDPGLYQKCIDSLGQYEKTQTNIFRKDYNYAKALPKIIIALSYVFGNNADAYVRQTSYYLEKLIANSNENQWALRYFAAQTYISIAAGSNKNSNLRRAYNLLKDNIRILSEVQENMLNEYYSPTGEIPRSFEKALDDANKELSDAKIRKENANTSTEKDITKEGVKKAEDKIKQIEKQIKQYKEYREKELPPFNSALWVNIIL